MALSKHNLHLLKSYDECTPLYLNTFFLSFIPRLVVKTPGGFKRSSFYSKLLNLSILIHCYEEEEG